MDQEGWFSIFVAAGLAAVLVVLYVFGPVWFPPPDTMQQGPTFDHVMSQLGAIADGVDHVASMLFSVTIGLFALVGIALRRGFPTASTARVVSLVSFVLFGATSLISLYLAFRERLEVVYAATLPSASLTDISDILGLHALFVSLSAIFAVHLGVDSLLRAGAGAAGKADEGNADGGNP